MWVLNFEYTEASNIDFWLFCTRFGNTNRPSLHVIDCGGGT